MARGWESKSVEAQQSEASDQPAQPHVKLSAGQAAIVREQENLRLARQRVLQQIESSTNPRHRQILQNALDELEARLSRLEEKN